MNACTVEGIYRFSGTLKNGWTSDSWGTLLVFNNQYNGSSGVSGTYLVQIALPTDGRMWTRQRVNTGAWTSWNKLANTTDCTDILKKYIQLEVFICLLYLLIQLHYLVLVHGKQCQQVVCY